MPLNPSPVTVRTLLFTQSALEVQRWEDSDPEFPQRAVLLTNEQDESVELTAQEELYETAQALLDQVEWLSHNEPTGSDIETAPSPCNWVVTICRQNDEGQKIETIGPMTKEACTPEWWDAEDVAWVAATPLEQPPLV